MGVGNKVLNSVSWQFMAVVSQAVMQILVLSVLSRMLEPEEFGVVAIANIVITFITMLTQGVLKPSIIQNTEVTAKYINTIFTLCVIQGCVIAAIVYSSSEYVASFFLNDLAADVLQVLCFSYFISSLGIVSEALLEKELNIREVAIANIFSYLLGYSVVSIGLAVAGYGVWSLVYAVLAQNTIKTILLYMKSMHSLKLYIALYELNSIISFSAGVMSWWVFAYIALQVDNFIVGGWMGAIALGYYSMAFYIMDIPRRFISSVVEKTLFPSLSIKQDNAESFKKISFIGFEMLNLLLIPIACFLVILAPEIVLVLLGSQWEPIIIPLQIMLIQIPFRSMIRVGDSINTARSVLYSNGVRKAIFAALVSLGVWFGHYHGIEYVAAGVTAAVVIYTFISLKLSLRVAGLSVGKFTKTLLPGILVGLLVMFFLGFQVFLMRWLGIAEWLVLITALVLVIFLAIIIVFKIPLILGEGWFWGLTVLEKQLPSCSKAKKIVSKMKKIEAA